MPIDNAAFVGSIPENYDRYLGSVLFEPYAKDLVERVSVPEGGSLLEIACGTGIVTRRLRDQLDKSVKIVATDLNEAMINYASQKFRADENVEWKPADALDLPFEDQSFDAVVCQFGLMFFPDKQQGVNEAYRVLKPNGQIEIAVVPFPCVSSSARDAAHGLIHGNPVITAINEREPAKGPEVEAALAERIGAQFGSAPVQARMQAIVCSAVR